MDVLNIKDIFFINYQSHLKPYGSMKLELSYLCLLNFIVCTNTNILTSILKQSNKLKWFKLYFFRLKNKKNLKSNIKIILYLIHQNHTKNLIILEIIGLAGLISFSFDISSMKFLKTINLKNYLKLDIWKFIKEKNMVLEYFNLKECLKLRDVTNILLTIKILRHLNFKNCKDIDKIGNKMYLELTLI